MRRLIPALTLAIALATGCSNDLTGPNGSVAGTYSLRTINGSPLPYNVGNQLLTSERMTLNTDGSYNDVVYYNNGTSRYENGYYTQFNNDITFDDQTDRIQYQGSVSGNVLTTFANGYTSAYQKN